MNKTAAVLIVMASLWSENVTAHAEALHAAITDHQPQIKDREPEYAKWSRMAFHEAAKLYTLLDYKYLGRSDVAPGVAQQQFRFWVKKNDAEFPLVVSIRYNPVTEKVYTILMEQEKRGDLRVL